jgi:hypothetical protein
MYMAKRNSANDIDLLREQYKRLADAVDGFYAGEEFQALNIAVTLRLLVHTTRKSRALLSRMDREYWDLTIQHRPLDPKVVFSVPITLRVSGDGTKGVVRSDFGSPAYQLVPLRQWWNGDYQAMGQMRLSKQRIILNVANKSGGAHIDSNVPDSHAALSEPPFFFGLVKGDKKEFMQPNLAYGITAQAGCEMQDCLERHFVVK